VTESTTAEEARAKTASATQNFSAETLGDHVMAAQDLRKARELRKNK
jgi:hypothetical protein